MSIQREAKIMKSVSQDEISNASMKFACSVINSFVQNDPEGNVIFSPISIYSALALVYFGATGNTRKEIAQIMDLPTALEQEIESQELFEILNEMMSAIRVVMGTKNKPERFIDVQNHLFIQSDINLIPSYVSHIEAMSGCEILNVDFENEPKHPTHIINDYVSRDTNGEISQCLAEPLVRSTRVVLASCMNLKLIWKAGFHHQSTKSAKFHTRFGDVDVQMMQYQTRDKLPYVDLPDIHLEALELPFKRNQESIYIILPKPEKSLDDVISSFTDHTILQKIINQVVPAYVNLSLPKLNLTCTGNLFEALQILGMNEAFSDQAQLNNMTTDPLLRISKIIHAVKVEFGEENVGTLKKMVKFCGTCSCCWKNTGSGITHSNSPSNANSPTNPILFDVNRQFLFFIYHRVTKSILFSGVIRNPNIE